MSYSNLILKGSIWFVPLVLYAVGWVTGRASGLQTLLL